MAVLLTPEQEAKVHRLRSQAKAVHVALRVIWEEKTGLFTQQTKLKNEKNRWREHMLNVSPKAEAELEHELAKVADRLNFLLSEEERAQAAWRAANALANSVEKYVESLHRGNRRVQSRHSQNLDFSETSILQTSSMVYEVNTEIVLDWE
jgi:plasmid stabilization system protein ParE